MSKYIKENIAKNVRSQASPNTGGGRGGYLDFAKKRVKPKRSKKTKVSRAQKDNLCIKCPKGCFWFLCHTDSTGTRYLLE